MQFVCEEINGTYKVRLDISDLKLNGREKLEPYLVFNCSTFKNVKEYDEDPTAFLHIFRAPNFALGKLTNDQKTLVAEFFASANYTIREKLPQDPNEFGSFVEQLGKQYFALVKQIDLYQLFKTYAATKISLQDTSTFGTRPQDTAELTFDESQMREMMIVAMFCKFASPLFGELINNIPEEVDPETGKKRLPRYKESKCSVFMTPVIVEYFQDLMDKFQVYVRHIVNGLCAKNQDPAAIFHGLTTSSRTNLIIASLLIRNYVLCELEKPDSNIIRYADTMVRTLVRTQDTNSHKFQFRTRKAPGSMMLGSDGDNTAQMEVDSLVSNGTMDGPIIIEASIDRIVQKYRIDYQITKAEFEGCLEFFKKHPIYQTPLNKFAATVVFGREIGGGRGIEEIDAIPYTKLIALLQLISFGLGYIDLGNALTVEKTNNVRMTLNMQQDNFKRMAPTLPHYRDLRARFSSSAEEEAYQDYKKSIREAEWDKQLDEIITDLATTIYRISTPDVILNMPRVDGAEPLSNFIVNGDQMEPTTAITEQMCMLIEIFTDDE